MSAAEKSPWADAGSPRRLVDLLDDYRCEGFDGYRELFRWGEVIEIPERDRAFLRVSEIVSVAAVEAADREERVHNRARVDVVYDVIAGLSFAAACIVVQAFNEKGLRGPVKREFARVLMKKFKEDVDYMLARGKEQE